MEFTKVVFALGCGFLFLTSCNKKESVVDLVKESIQLNAESKTYLDWKQSGKHPDDLFKKWQDDFLKNEVTSEEICKSLVDLKSSDLTIFEEQIKSDDNTNLLKECKIELTEKLKQYWQDQEKDLEKNGYTKPQTLWSAEAVTANYRFPDKNKSLDLSAGYYAVTGPTERKEVILTFDDGPHKDYTQSIVQNLNAVNAKGIFFMLGQNVNIRPNIVKQVASSGHAVGGHTMTHPCLSAKNICKSNNKGKLLTFAEAKAQIQNSMKAIFNVLGYVDPYFRFPFGESSAELKLFLKNNNIGEFYWSLDTDDWRQERNKEVWDSKKMLEYIMTTLNNGQQRGVILMHDIQKKTQVVMPYLLKRLYDNGYTPVVLKQNNSQERTSPKIVVNPSY